MLLGAHVPAMRPLDAAQRRGAEVVQVFLSAPRAWRPPKVRDDAAQLRASDLPIYVHAPYLVNVVAGDRQVRERSRQSLVATTRAAATIGAAGVVVHGGHQPVDAPLDAGIEAWRTLLAGLGHEVPILIENTAGGRNAMAREPERFVALWAGLADLEVPLGVCVDTCHLHAATPDELLSSFDQVRTAVGRVDLLHVNDSRDEPGSGRDRHANLGAGTIDPETLVELVRRADSPVVVETPGGSDGQARDLLWLRQRLTAAGGERLAPA